ncbi:MAG: histidine kinase [Limnohabitans sp.]|nr:histidine kinase [Limnohabitans sp.]
MNELPYEIKVTYVIAITIMMLFVVFIIFMVLIYNKKQILLLKEKQLQEATHQNELLQTQLDKQKALENERERISKDMHDDLGAGISSIKLQGEYILEKFELNPKLKTEIEELISTTSEITTSMREMIWSLKIQNDNINSFINYITQYTSQFLSKTGIKCTFQTSITENNTLLENETRRNLFLCIKEALNNIYKHSQATEVNIVFILEKDSFQIHILDNGIGISENPNGNGLKNMQDRMQTIGGAFKIIDCEKGTSLLFSCTI